MTILEWLPELSEQQQAELSTMDDNTTASLPNIGELGACEPLWNKPFMPDPQDFSIEVMYGRMEAEDS